MKTPTLGDNKAEDRKKSKEIKKIYKKEQVSLHVNHIKTLQSKMGRGEGKGSVGGE
jgi:hypothetical protein